MSDAFPKRASNSRFQREESVCVVREYYTNVEGREAFMTYRVTFDRYMRGIRIEAPRYPVYGSRNYWLWRMLWKSDTLPPQSSKYRKIIAAARRNSPEREITD